MSLVEVEDTIVAIATPSSPAQRGVVRLTGPKCQDVLQRLLIGQSYVDLIQPVARRQPVQVQLGELLGPVSADLLWWPTTRSYTSQPSAEFHTFGCLPILTAFVRRSIESGARAARPGEFTMRAFLAGRLDLTQAEAVLGVIDAETRGSLDVALEQLAGNLSKPLEETRSQVLDLLADVEAGLDFVDEDIEFIDEATLTTRLRAIHRLLQDTGKSMQDRGGGSDRPVVALRGEPNAGKSCLLNRLASKPVAIVSDVAGTTRDAVTCEASLRGQEVVLTDTAGVEDRSSHISEQAQRQGERASRSARIRLWCVDASREDFEAACQRVEQIAGAEQRPSVIDLFVATKIDVNQRDIPADWLGCSAVEGTGVAGLIQRITESLSRADQQEIGSIVGTAARCRQSIDQASAATEAALGLLQCAGGHELIATELREIARHIGEVTGAVYTDDILDRVFSRFCIGK